MFANCKYTQYVSIILNSVLQALPALNLLFNNFLSFPSNMSVKITRTVNLWEDIVKGVNKDND